jgi:hypothetical protein
MVVDVAVSQGNYLKAIAEAESEGVVSAASLRDGLV